MTTYHFNPTNKTIPPQNLNISFDQHKYNIKKSSQQQQEKNNSKKKTKKKQNK